MPGQQSAATESIPIASIVIGTRVRKELGDLKALSQSIDEIGLLHPLVVDTASNLIAGKRRLDACKLLGWDSIPVHRVDLSNIISGEQAENLERKNFIPSEIVALKRAIEPLERLEAKQRQGMRTDRLLVATVDTKFGKARDRIARALGVGRITVDRAEAVVKAAEVHPKKYGWLLERMDRTGNVAHAYRQLGIDKLAEEISRRPPAMPEGPFDVIVADPPWRYNSGDLP